MGLDFTAMAKPGDLCYWNVRSGAVLTGKNKYTINNQTWLGIISKVKPALVVVYAPALRKYIKVRRSEVLEIERSKDG